MGTRSLMPAAPKGPAIPKAPSTGVPRPKNSMPRIRTIKRMMMRGGGGRPNIPPFGVGG
jgi:hypothetical protein